MRFKEYISESINDKGRLKALFVIGLPGAGKTYTISKISGSISPRVVNTDRAAEFLASKWGKTITADSWPEFEDKSLKITSKTLLEYINGMLPLFIDGTSNDVSNILHRVGILESLGYDVGVVFVSTDLDVALKRAKDRAEKSNRIVDEDFIRKVHSQNEDNANFLKQKTSFFITVNNNDDSLGNEEMIKAYKKSQNFFIQPLANPIGQRYIKELESSKDKYLTPNLLNKDVLAKKITGWYKN